LYDLIILGARSLSSGWSSDGWHISELNFISESLTCPENARSASALPDCLGITSNRYSIITAIFTVGGLFGALATAKVISRFGMYGSIWLTGTINLAGSGLMALSAHWVMLLVGRSVGVCGYGMRRNRKLIFHYSIPIVSSPAYA